MKILEELSMNAFPPLQTLLYDGWIIRFADGYTNRANSINPIYQSLENVHEKIEKCEMLFRRQNLKPTYKMTPFVHPENLDELLENKGYTAIHPTSVQTLDLSYTTEPSGEAVITSCNLEDEWFESYCKMNDVTMNNKKTYRRMLDNLIPMKVYTSLLMGNEIIACGMAVLENDFMGLFDITVDRKYRNNGYGTQLLMNMLASGKAVGAKKAYLQVMLDNLPALHLYGKLGFKEEYRYCYRVLADSR